MSDTLLPCFLCGESTRGEYYRLRDEVWRSLGGDVAKAEICIGCMEERLGRPLHPSDFDLVPINFDLGIPKSPRLLERLGSAQSNQTGNMNPTLKASKSTKSSRNQKTAGWIRENHSEIDAAASLYGRTWSEMGLTTKGAVIAVITKALYRIGRRPGFKPTLESMRQLMQRETVAKEVQHQLDLGEDEQEQRESNAQKTRETLVASIARKANVANADEMVQRLLNWLTLIPGLRNTQQIMILSQLYIAQAGALRIIRPPTVPETQIDELARRSPARIVRPQKGVTFLILAKNETVDWTRGHTRITEQMAVAA